jgi:hypothetical protein
VLFWNVPNSPIGGSFGVDAAAGSPRGEPCGGRGKPGHSSPQMPDSSATLSSPANGLLKFKLIGADLLTGKCVSRGILGRWIKFCPQS